MTPLWFFLHANLDKLKAFSGDDRYQEHTNSKAASININLPHLTTKELQTLLDLKASSWTREFPSKILILLFSSTL